MSEGEFISPQDTLTPGRCGQGRLFCEKARGVSKPVSLGTGFVSRWDNVPPRKTYRCRTRDLISFVLPTFQ